MYWCELARILFAQGVYRTRIVGVGFIHAVNEDNERFVEFKAIVDYAFRAYGKYAVRAYNEYRRAASGKSFVPFAFKIVKSRQIEKIYLYAFPYKIRHGGVYGKLF